MHHIAEFNIEPLGQVMEARCLVAKQIMATVTSTDIYPSAPAYNLPMESVKTTSI